MKPIKLNLHDLIMIAEHLRDKEHIDEVLLVEYGDTVALTDSEDPETILVSFDGETGGEGSEVH